MNFNTWNVNDRSFVNFFVVLSRKLPAGIKMLSRMYCLLECVHGLCIKGPVSYHVSAVNDEAKGICQLNWYGTQVLLHKKK